MRISSGSKDLDGWLEGGFESDIITTFYGPAGSGKTNLCLLAAANAARKGKKVIFVDTEGGFSVDRLNQIADENLMKKIILLKPTNFIEQRNALDKIAKLVSKDIGLIIVDSLVMLYRLELGEALTSDDRKRAQIINRILAKQLRILSGISRKKNIPVLVTNQVYGEFLTKEEFAQGKEKGVVMVGGSIVKYWSKCIIELKNLEEGKKKAILKKHRSLPEKEFYFQVDNKGIKKTKF